MMSTLEIINVIVIPTLLYATYFIIRGWWLKGREVSEEVDWRSVLFILPVKDPPKSLPESIRALSRISPESKLVISYEGEKPSVPMDMDIEFIEARNIEGYTGKISNLVSALKKVDLDKFKYIVFIDDDIIPNITWITSLISEASVRGVATGYRVYRPKGLAGIFLSLWSLYSLDTMLSEKTRIVWGGSAAFNRETLDVQHLFKMWRGAVSDDVAYTYYVRNCLKRVIGFNHNSLVENIGYDRLSEAIRFVVRQQRIVYWYGRSLWLTGVAYHLYIWIVTLTSILNIFITTTTGPLLQILTLLIYLSYGVRIWFRAAHSSNIIGLSIWDRVKVSLVSPLILLIQLPLLLSSIGDTIRWRGRMYRLPRIEDLEGYCIESA